MFPVIDNPLQGAHGFADDTQLYCSLNTNCAGVRELKIEEMKNCILSLRDWMAGSKLGMNDDKTECMCYLISQCPYMLGVTFIILSFLTKHTRHKPFQKLNTCLYIGGSSPLCHTSDF